MSVSAFPYGIIARAGGGVTIALSTISQVDAFTPLDTPATITAGMEFQSGGLQRRRINATYTSLSPFWMDPAGGDSGSNYQIRFTESGTTGSGFTRSYVSGTAYNLASTKEITITKTISNSSQNCSVTGTLSLETSGSSVLDTQGITFELFYLE